MYIGPHYNSTQLYMWLNSKDEKMKFNSAKSSVVINKIPRYFGIMQSGLIFLKHQAISTHDSEFLFYHTSFIRNNYTLRELSHLGLKFNW